LLIFYRLRAVIKAPFTFIISVVPFVRMYHFFLKFDIGAFTKLGQENSGLVQIGKQSGILHE
jgi:hypothetical protein